MHEMYVNEDQLAENIAMLEARNVKVEKLIAAGNK